MSWLENDGLLKAQIVTFGDEEYLSSKRQQFLATYETVTKCA